MYNFYNNEFVLNLIHHCKFKNKNKKLSLNEIRILICLTVLNCYCPDLKKLLDILFDQYDYNFILKLLLYYKNKVAISKEGFKELTSKKEKINLYINFNIENDISNYSNYHNRILYNISDETVTPLHVACHFMRLGQINLLLDYGADINIKNSYGETPFFFTCKYSMSSCVPKLLIKRNANIFIRDNENNSVLYVYSKQLCKYNKDWYRIGMLIDLLNAGFDINERNENGRTPFMEICYCDNVEFIEYFMHHGADIYLKDKNGQTGLSIAQSMNNRNVVYYLIEHGALWKFCNYSKKK